jgi:hypothetical protein
MKTLLILLMAFSISAKAQTGMQYTAQQYAVLAESPKVYHEFVRDGIQGDNAACQRLVDAHQAVMLMRSVTVYLVRVEGDLAVVRTEGSNAELWTSVSMIKR